MFNKIVFSDEITLWWTKDEFDKSVDLYKLYLDGVYHGETKKTHYSFLGLTAERAYGVRIEAYMGAELIAKRSYTYTTEKAKNRIDVTRSPYNAVGDGKTLNTKALQMALDVCTENDYVYIPAGEFLTGALTLHSDTELFLAEGAILQGTSFPVDYLPMKKSRYEGLERECYRSLLNFGTIDRNGGYTSKNLVLRGKGSIYGGGRELLIATMEEAGAVFRPTGPINEPEAKAWRSRGRLLEVCNAENVVISGLKLGRSSSWNLHFIYSRNIVTFDCEIFSKNINNGDGWNPDSSENCAIFDTVFETGDDCIAIKSGKNPEGNIINRPTRNVYIFDCKTRAGHSVAIGSEMSGGVENVRIWDCDFKDCGMGVQIKSIKERGGYVKNIYVCDSQMKMIYVRAAPYANDSEAAETPPRLGNYFYENITLFGRETDDCKDYICLEGYEDPDYYLNDVHFRDITFVGAEEEQKLRSKFVKNLSLTEK